MRWNPRPLRQVHPSIFVAEMLKDLQQLRLQLGGCDLISSDCKVVMSQLPFAA